MQIQFLSKFNRDLDRIHLKGAKKGILNVIDEIKSVDSIHQVKNIKKLTGFKSAYRIRVGDYRIGSLLTATPLSLPES